MLSNYKKIKQVIKGKKYDLFVAKTDKQKKIGLSSLKKIKKNQGMFFPYREEKPKRSFTMKNVNFPLTIIFLDRNMKIIYAEKGLANQRNLIVCEKPSMYVIEIPC